MEPNPQLAPERPITVDEARTGGRSWWQACCVGCLLFVVVGIVGLIFLFRFIAGPPVEFLKELPASYPKDIKLLKIEDATSISYAPGQQKSRVLQIASTPLRWLGEVVATSANDQGKTDEILGVYGSQIAQTDAVTVMWRPLMMRPEDVVTYYTGELRREGFEVRALPPEQDSVQVEFVALRKDASIQATLIPSVDNSSVEQLILTTTYATTATH